MQLARLEHSIENADAAPTAAQVEACQTAANLLHGLMEQWQQLKKTDLKSLNEQLERRHLAVLNLDLGRGDHRRQDQIEMNDEE